MITQQQYNVHLQKIRQTYVKLDWLNWNEVKVDEVQGKLIDGNIAINGDGAIRRSCNLRFELITDNKFLPSPNSYVWLNYKFRLWVGIRDLITDEIVWFNKGIYYLNKPSVTHSIAERTVSLEGLDKMAWYDGTLNGQLTHQVYIPSGSDIGDVLKSLLEELGETKFNIEPINKTTPYTIEKSVGDNYYNIIKELRDLYAGWECFYDENGYFVFRKMKNGVNDPIVWDFSSTDLTIEYKSEPEFENVKNHIIIWGFLDKDIGIQINYTIENNDLNSPFSIAKVGKRELPVVDENIFTLEQAQDRAEYELYIHSHLNEKVLISCVPIYYLDVNQCVNFNNPNDGIIGKYKIDYISYNLRHDALMSLNLTKVYNEVI